ncbi:MAG: asparagine--tRNA ligase [Bdellovibrionaceae bacterium]|nr:asparagine--tRNA ligase [Pseudobdellovibrionaceae bacterium]
MNQKVSIKDLALFEAQEIELKAWVCQFRSSGKIAFLVLRDGTGECQAVLNEESTEIKSFELFSEISLECLVEVQAKVKKWKETFELEVSQLKILSSSSNYPIAKKAHGVDFLLDNRHLWLRSKRQRAILKVRSEVMRYIHDFFQRENFVQVSAPILMPTASEGTSSLFSVDFFEENQVFLSQSGQLHMEAASSALSKVYCFGPTFRAEKSSTRRHLLEFWMVEPEMAFYSYKETMDLAERFVEYVVQNTIQNKSEELEILGRDIKKLEKIKSPFPKITYKSACDILKKKRADFTSGKDFGALDESLLSEEFGEPVFVYHYPKNIKAFYMKEDSQNSDLSLSFDLLAPESYGELVGGSEREDNLELLLKKIKKHDLEEKHFKWYLDLRRYGSFPHSGFGLGLERLVCWICGLDHVREAIPFPRLYGRSFFEKEG